MYKYFFLFLVLSIFYFTSCTKDDNPIKYNDGDDIRLSGGCSFSMVIVFDDTCSYDFILTFISNFDSILVEEISLGSVFYLYADSADKNYWHNFFETDTTIKYISIYTSSDSLIIRVESTGEKSTAEEQLKFSSIRNLELIKLKVLPKTVYIEVPDNTENEWIEIFESYPFISSVFMVGVCHD